ncbi:MAG: ABC transporter permease [Sphaerochaetaceae bacterium]|nr:ABC transporter permease [Sphaerochaetaceae bacterium]
MQSKLKKVFSSKEGVLFVIFVLIFILMSILSPHKFLSNYNIQSLAYQLPEFGILSLSMMLIIMTGGINLSLTFTATLSMIVGGLAMSSSFESTGMAFLSVLIGVVIMLLVSAVLGMFNGLVVSYIGVTPMLATLGASTLFEGISLNITKGGAISGFPFMFLNIGNSAILGIPVPMIIFIVVLVYMWILLEKSRMGAAIVMIGCNPKVAEYSGIRVKKILFQTYIISGILAGIAGIIMASRYNSAKESYGSSYLLQSVAASVLGGTNISGGEGKVLGTLLAAMILQIISSGLNIFGLNRYLTNVLMGFILILVLAINFITDYLKKNK